MEGERQEREKARLRQTLNIARTRQLSKERNYDIVKHTSHLKETEVSAVCVKDVVFPHNPNKSQLTMKLIIRPKRYDGAHYVTLIKFILACSNIDRAYTWRGSFMYNCDRSCKSEKEPYSFSFSLFSLPALVCSPQLEPRRHDGVFPQEPVLRLTRQPDSRTPYNILNHVPREDACSSALIYSDRELPKVMPPKALSVEGEKKPRSHMRRDVDILSNRCAVFERG